MAAQAQSLISNGVSHQGGATTTFNKSSDMGFAHSTPRSVLTKSSFSSSSRKNHSSSVYSVNMYKVSAAMRNVTYISYLRGYQIPE